MSLKKTLVTVSLLLIVFSCSKKNVSQVQNSCNEITAVILHTPYNGDDTVAKVSYDGQGRVDHVVGDGFNRTKYVYFADSIEVQAFDVNGTNISFTYYLDNKGRITRSNYFNYKYTYDNSGYLISYDAPFSYNGAIVDSAHYTLTYQNGNLFQRATSKPNVSDSLQTYYYYDKRNQDLLGYISPFYLGGIIGDRNSFFLIKAGFFGKQSTNLLQKIDFHNQYITSSDEVYLYDSTGRINGWGLFSFQYKCK